MTENDVNPYINNDPMEKRNKFIDHPSYMIVCSYLSVYCYLSHLFKCFMSKFYTMTLTIHVIFSWAQIGRSTIFGREIGVPDREIFKFNVKNCLFASP